MFDDLGMALGQIDESSIRPLVPFVSFLHHPPLPRLLLGDSPKFDLRIVKFSFVFLSAEFFNSMAKIPFDDEQLHIVVNCIALVATHVGQRPGRGGRIN